MSASDIELEEDVFIIHKHENPERLKKWRQATLVLNATRRFRYTLNLEGKEEARNVPSKRVRASTQVIRAKLPPPNGFGLGPRKLHNLVKGQELNFLQQLGGVLSVAKSLRSNLEDGLNEDVDDMILRKKHFGENNYPRKHPKSFFVFAWEAAKDTTLIILMFCAAVSLITGMTSEDEGIKEGWYDGTSITIAILIVVLVTEISDYKQSLEFQVLNNEKKNIDVQVVRMGRRIKVSIFNLVVGDVVSLNIGDQIGMDFKSVRSQSTIYQMEAFNSIRKRAGIALILSNGDARVHWKGAAEVILDLCNTYLDEEGRVVELNKEKVREVISEMAANSLHCIVFAYQNLNNTLLPKTEQQKATWKIPDEKLSILAIVGIKSDKKVTR